MEKKLSNATAASSSNRPPSERDVIFETDKLILLKDKHGVYGEAAPSKLAPEYLQELLEGPVYDEPSYNDSFDSSCSRTYEELEQWKLRVQEEERLSRMYKLKRTFSLRFDNRAWVHPHGTSNFDYKAISNERKEKFDHFKNRVREENYQYLGCHPEIQAIISLAMKRVLNALPADPVKFLTEFFTTRMGNMKEFEDSVESEGMKISRYHVNKMKAAGKINLRPSTAVRSEISGESWRPEQDANSLKKMNIGALAQDFSFDASSLKPKKKKSEHAEKLKLNKKKKQPHKYCGCKDWKLIKNRTLTAEVSEQEEVQTTTFSTLGNLNDNLLTSAEDDEEEEEEEEIPFKFGDGEFLGDMEEREDEHDNLTTAEAEEIAGFLVKELLGDGAGLQASQPYN